jgi:hypothetical protein
MKLPFKKVYNFRPAMLEPTKGLKNTLSLYKYFGWMAPILRLLAPNQISTLQQLGKSMIFVTINGYKKQNFDVKDIKETGSNLK